MILPQPDAHFEWIGHAQGPALECRPLLAFARHVFTSRAWPLAASTALEDDGAWLGVAQAVGLDGAGLLRARQAHGAEMVVHRAGRKVGARAEADILITDDRNVAVTVQTADCLPILIADTRTGAVASVHAGWRGIAARVPLLAVQAMENELGSRASKLIVAVGPSIGSCCYEVGDDLRRRFEAAGFGDWELSRWFSREPRPSARNPSMAGVPGIARETHWFLDLWTAARDQLRVSGVREDRIFVAEVCTASHAEAFCSYRRDGAGAGRMAAAIRSLNF